MSKRTEREIKSEEISVQEVIGDWEKELPEFFSGWPLKREGDFTSREEMFQYYDGLG